LDLLVSFLVDNGYADNHGSAEKILECISDEFYAELLESATQRLAQLNVQMRQAMQSGDSSKLAKIAAEIKAAKAASAQEYKDKGSPKEQKAPATRGERPQTRTSGRKAAPDPREGMRSKNVEREADRLIGNSVPKPSYLSPSAPAHLQSQQAGNLYAADRRGERRGITGQTRSERRSGVTGRYENPNRFDDRNK
jgi:hypothetical protein